MSALTITEVARASVTDLGRFGHAHVGVQAVGAADQVAARRANILVGNADNAPLVESLSLGPFAFTTDVPMLIAVTGAAGVVTVDGLVVPGEQPVITWPGAAVRIEPARAGLRCYVAIRGELKAAPFLGSVANDPLIGIGSYLSVGERVEVNGGDVPDLPFLPLLLPPSPVPALTNDWTLEVVEGPEVDEFPGLLDDLAALSFRVGRASDHVGVRWESAKTLARNTDREILSRGVPLGAVEIPPGGGPIALLRGRPLTAGYPIPLVVARHSHSALGQVRPGDTVRLRLVSSADALAALVRQENNLSELRARCTAMYDACAQFSSPASLMRAV